MASIHSTPKLISKAKSSRGIAGHARKSGASRKGPSTKMSGSTGATGYELNAMGKLNRHDKRVSPGQGSAMDRSSEIETFSYTQSNKRFESEDE